MSDWQQHQIEQKVLAILGQSQSHSPGHHFGTPFMTAYQVAIEFERQFPQVVQALALPVGGAGTGQRTSLAQYLARELSSRINDGSLATVEGAFLSRDCNPELYYEDGSGQRVQSSAKTSYCLSLFRLKVPGTFST